MTTVTFKTKALRTITSPSDSGVTTYLIMTEFQDLPSNISLEVNPRKPKMNTNVAKQLIKAVLSEENIQFDINNRGMVLTAKSVKFNNSKGEVTIDFGEDTERYGVLDGGHTYTAIIENRDKLSPENKKYVRLEVVVGENLNVTALAEARNTSLQVSDIALYELDEKFDFIKEAISGQSYSGDVAYKDNEDKAIPVAELLRLLFAFNVKRFPDDAVVPVQVYSAKASVFKDYSKELENDDNIYKQLAPYLPMLVELYETIILEMPDKYKKFKEENGTRGAFGKIRGVQSSQNVNRNFTAMFTGMDLPYEIPVGFVYPIFGAFRALLKIDDSGELKWLSDPVEIWEKCGVRLIQNTFETETNPQQAGKMKTLWQSNYRIVESAMKDKLIEELMNSKR